MTVPCEALAPGLIVLAPGSGDSRPSDRNSIKPVETAERSSSGHLCSTGHPLATLLATLLTTQASQSYQRISAELDPESGYPQCDADVPGLIPSQHHAPAKCMWGGIFFGLLLSQKHWYHY
ncbi:hypothetical protein OAK25_00630 [Synechococcus sp. AH-551-P10]|nr:hypothetical protein [Synechococcus sp. AH-551-P10]